MRRYLLVDDNVPLAENLAEILSDEGVCVEVAEGGVRALELLRQERFDALVTDLRMPAMSGTEVVREVRRIDPGLPALVLTAYTGDLEPGAAGGQGLLAVLTKPVALERLAALLANARRDGLVALLNDDAQLIEGQTELLRSHGFSAVAARALLDSEGLLGLRPFAALIDLHFPDSSGAAALARLQALCPELPILVITDGAAARGSLGPQGGSERPVEPGELLATLEQMHERRSA